MMSKPVLPPKTHVGFTLPQVVVAILIASLLALMIGATKPLITDEQAAALSVSRTYFLLNAAFDDYQRSLQYPLNAGWPWSWFKCQLPQLILDHSDSYQNGFGEAFKVSCKQESPFYKVYQVLPQTWAPYVANNLERTRMLTLDDAKKDSQVTELYGNPTMIYKAKRQIVETLIDRYGNERVYFRRLPFKPIPDSYAFWDKRSTPNDKKGAKIEIEKPQCQKGQSPQLSYSVAGSCSAFPAQLTWAQKNSLSELSTQYVSSGFRYRLTGEDAASTKWVIYAETHEYWGSSDAESGSTTQQAWAGMPEQCYDNFSYSTPAVEERLYLDVWVGCQ